MEQKKGERGLRDEKGTVTHFWSTGGKHFSLQENRIYCMQQN